MADENFRLNPSQAMGLTLVDLQLQQLGAASAIIGSPNINLPELQKVIAAAIEQLNAAKMTWLRSTQTAVQLIPDAANVLERIKANGRHP